MFFPEPVANKHVMIVLGATAETNVYYGLTELAQEIVHVLSPIPGNILQASNLEEGIATDFAVAALKKFFGIDWQPDPTSKHFRAWQVAEPLLRQYPDAIKQMRLVQPEISRITEDLIKLHFPTISAADAKFLADPF
jgi:hypothetical protein